MRKKICYWSQLAVFFKRSKEISWCCDVGYYLREWFVVACSDLHCVCGNDDFLILASKSCHLGGKSLRYMFLAGRIYLRFDRRVFFGVFLVLFLGVTLVCAFVRASYPLTSDFTRSSHASLACLSVSMYSARTSASFLLNSSRSTEICVSQCFCRLAV